MRSILALTLLCLSSCAGQGELGGIVTPARCEAAIAGVSDAQAVVDILVRRGVIPAEKAQATLEALRAGETAAKLICAAVGG